MIGSAIQAVTTPLRDELRERIDACEPLTPRGAAPLTPLEQHD
ncbi:hypothetical protein [Nocardioides nematodiphilus]|nr:hypothetical protein [Nocardioides nematodiphilus]